MVAEGKVVFKDREVKEFLNELSKNVNKVEKRAKAVWGILAGRAYADVIDHFEKESGPNGKWKPIKRLGQILQDKGTLRGGITLATNKSDIKRGVLLFDAVPYAKTHDEGLTVKTKYTTFKMPMRKFFWISDKALNNMSEDILNFLMKGTK